MSHGRRSSNGLMQEQRVEGPWFPGLGFRVAASH